jgi:predicted Fe-Mo cluster-binding NifX family protein
MNVRLEYDLTWRSAIWFENCLQLNDYTATISMITNTSVSEDHTTCMDRINHFVYHELANTVFVHQEDREQMQLLAAAGIKFTPLPEQPIDQIVGLVLYCKLNAIVEDRMHVTAVAIQSELGDNIRYLHSEHEGATLMDQPGWWQDSNPAHNNFKQTGNSKKQVVKLNRTPSWRELDLDWSDAQRPTIESNTVVFAKFPLDEN